MIADKFTHIRIFKGKSAGNVGRSVGREDERGIKNVRFIHSKVFLNTYHNMYLLFHETINLTRAETTNVF